MLFYQEIFPLNPLFIICGGAFRSQIVKVGALSAPIQEILLKYSLDLPYIQTGICFIEVFANTPYLQGVHHTHISGDHNDP